MELRAMRALQARPILTWTLQRRVRYATRESTLPLQQRVAHSAATEQQTMIGALPRLAGTAWLDRTRPLCPPGSPAACSVDQGNSLAMAHLGVQTVRLGSTIMMLTVPVCVLHVPKDGLRMVLASI